MPVLKKLIPALPFLIVFTILIYQISPLLASYDFLFALSVSTLIQLIIISSFIFLTSLLFVLFATIASDWKIILPVVLISLLISLIFIPMPLGLIFVVAVFVSLLLIALNLSQTLKSYINFQPSGLLGPGIRHLSALLILSFCIIFFLSINQTIIQDGFQIPDSLIDSALKMSPVNLPAEQGPTAPLNLINDLIKQTVKDQIQGFIKPYLSFIPAVLAVLLFLTLQSLTSILNLLVSPLLWITFYILEKTGFTKYETEMREVKKLVV